MLETTEFAFKTVRMAIDKHIADSIILICISYLNVHEVLFLNVLNSLVLLHLILFTILYNKLFIVCYVVFIIYSIL